MKYFKTLMKILALVSLALLSQHAFASEISKTGEGNAQGSMSGEEEIIGSTAKIIKMIEGMETDSDGLNELAQLAFNALNFPDARINLGRSLNKPMVGGDKKEQDILFVFGLLALALDDKDDEAFAYLQRYQPDLTYMDKLPLGIQPQKPGQITFIDESSANNVDILHFAYAWLINHTEVIVPCWFIEQYPGLVYHGTPFWAAGRDAYFRVCVPKDWNLSSLQGYSEFQVAIIDADNPGGCFMGTIPIARKKSLVINEGVLANNPEFFLRKDADDGDTSKWIRYWQYIGPYNHGVARRLLKSATQLQASLAEMLEKTGKLTRPGSRVVAERYVNNLISSAVGSSYDTYETYVREATATRHGWEAWEEPPPSFTLNIVGGYLLYEKPTEDFMQYVKWLQKHDSWEPIHSLLTTAAADNSDALRQMLALKVPYPAKWGKFNKSPLHYAVQYNNSDSYHQLKSIQEMDTLTIISEYPRECEIPQIAKRNVLTYAAENADAALLFQVANDFGKKYGAMTDTDGRSIQTYLSNNINLSKQEMKKVVILLGQPGR